MEYLYAVGNKVRIKGDLNNLDHGKECGVVTDMLEFRGKTANIVGVFPLCEYYTLDVDGGKWYWDAKMFDVVVVEETPIFTKENFFVELTLDEVIALATEKLGKAVKIKK